MLSTIVRARRSVRLRAVAGTVALLLTVAGCGVSGSDANETDPPTTTAAGKSTTSRPNRTTTTETDQDPLTDGALRALLPSAAEVGSEYQLAVDDSEDEDDDDSDLKEAMKSSCPDAAAFMNDSAADDRNEIEQDYETDDDRTVAISLNPRPRNMGEENLDRVIGVINGCDTIEVETSGGISMALVLSAERDDTFGDRGAVMQMKIQMNSPLFEGPLNLGARMRAFVVGPVSVSINAGDGFDEVTLATVPGDYYLIDGLAAEMETKVEDLVG